MGNPFPCDRLFSLFFFLFFLSFFFLPFSFLIFCPPPPFTLQLSFHIFPLLAFSSFSSFSPSTGILKELKWRLWLLLVTCLTQACAIAARTHTCANAHTCRHVWAAKWEEARERERDGGGGGRWVGGESEEDGVRLLGVPSPNAVTVIPPLPSHARSLPPLPRRSGCVQTGGVPYHIHCTRSRGPEVCVCARGGEGSQQLNNVMLGGSLRENTVCVWQFDGLAQMRWKQKDLFSQ